MQQTNNYVPTIITRGARRATRWVGSGDKSMRWYKKECHRSYRHMMNQRLHNITSGYIDVEEYNDDPGHCRCTAWDIA
jgi:hypothetical protein